MRFVELKKHKKQIYQIAAKDGVKEVSVFGSIAREESTDVSDVDFLIEMEIGASASRSFDIICSLE